VAAAERRKVGPIVGVRALGGRRVVRRGEIVLNGSRELGEDGSVPLERLNRGQRVPASVVSGERADLKAVGRRFHAFSSVGNRRGSRAWLRSHALATIDAHIHASGSDVQDGLSGRDTS